MTDPQHAVLIETAREMNRCGLNRGTSGNVSLRAEGGMWITPSALPYESLQADDLVFVDFSGTPSGTQRPSSEWRFHLDIYRQRSDARAVLHAHPVHCTALACLRRSIPAFHYMVAVAGGRNIRCAPYETFGTQALSERVMEALQGRLACLLANHGLVCLGPDLPAALSLAVEIEQLAESYLECLAAGEPAILDDAEMESVLLKFKDYRSGLS
jgi:L-fuculose-phosphate aldolase